MDKFTDAGILASMLAVMMGLLEVIKSQLRKRLGGNGKSASHEGQGMILTEAASQLRRSNEIQERIMDKLDIVVERQAVNTERLCTIQRDLGEVKRKGAA